MAVGVGDDDLAALIDAVDAGVIAGLVLADGVFPDDVAFADAQSLGGFLGGIHNGVIGAQTHHSAHHCKALLL